jgi:hypothetical protein
MEERSIASQLVTEIDTEPILEKITIPSRKKTSLWVGGDSPEKKAWFDKAKKQYGIDKLFGEDVPVRPTVQTDNTSSNSI